MMHNTNDKSNTDNAPGVTESITRITVTTKSNINATYAAGSDASGGGIGSADSVSDSTNSATAMVDAESSTGGTEVSIDVVAYKARKAKRKKETKRRTYYTILIISIIIFAICAANVLHDIYTRRQGQDFYSNLATHVEPSVVEEAEESPPPIDFDALRDIYPDIIGWISCVGPGIDLPIVQTSDDDFYLSHLPNGEKNKMGSIFLHYRNASDFSDVNTMVFGHNMKTGDMFGNLKDYHNQAFYEEHPVMTIYIPGKEFVLELISGYTLDSAYEVPPMSFEDASAFEVYIQNIIRRSHFKSDVEVNYGDRIVCLVTCTPASDNTRFIVVGKLNEVK